MPKEHFMILPQMPADVLKDLSLSSKKIVDLMFKAFKPSGMDVFLANGQIAGQKAPHVMFHLIPRYEGVSMKLADKETKSEELEKVFQQLQPLLAPMSTGTPTTESGTAPSPPAISPGIPEKMSEEELLTMIEENPKIKEYLLRDPADFSKKLDSLPQLAAFFKGFDLNELCKKLRGVEQQQVSYDALLGILADNPGLKEMLLTDPTKLKENIAKTPQLQMVFKGYDIDELNKKLKGGPDLDKISGLFP